MMKPFVLKRGVRPVAEKITVFFDVIKFIPVLLRDFAVILTKLVGLKLVF
jgi:hypothetical protein